MPDTPYCAAADVQRILQGIDVSASLAINDQNPAFTAICWDATRQIERMTRRDFRLKDYDDRYDGNGSNQLVLRNYPIVSVTLLKAFNWYPAAFYIFTSDEFYIDADRGLILLLRASTSFSLYTASGGILGSFLFPVGTRNIQIQYRAGYAEIPYDIVEATAKMAAIRVMTGYTGKVTDGLQSFSLDGLSLSFGQGLYSRQNEQWQKDIDSVVNYYKRLIVGRA